MYEDIKTYTLGEKMTYYAYNPITAADSARAKGNAIGYTAAVYSQTGVSNIAAPSVEVLNQNGYSIYMDDETGKFKVVKDRNTYGGSVWSSDSLGVTFIGDTFIPNASEDSDNGYYDRNSFLSKGDDILNKIYASNSSGKPYSSLSGLNSDETIDPRTGEVVDKEKSQAVDAIVNKDSAQYKFDKIAEKIVKAFEAKNEPEKSLTIGEAATNVGGGAIAGAILGGAIGLLGGPAGAVLGAKIGAGLGGALGAAVTGYSAYKSSDANGVVNNNAKDAMDDLNDSLAELLKEGNEEEFIAFERYYYEKTGANLSDVLKTLEIDEDDDNKTVGYSDEDLINLFERMDEANDYLKPDETDKADETTETDEMTLEERLVLTNKIKMIESDLKYYYDQMIASRETGKAIVNGKEMTTDEIKALYDKACIEYANAMAASKS